MVPVTPFRRVERWKYARKWTGEVWLRWAEFADVTTCLAIVGNAVGDVKFVAAIKLR